MRVLLTGGTGFVGLNIVSALRRAGHDVVATGHAPPATGFVDAEPGATWRTLDVRDAAAASDLLREVRPDVVIHGAAVTTAAARDGEAALATAAVNVMGTLHVLEAALGAGVGRFVHLSSASVYGGATRVGRPLDEEASIPQPETAYAVTKYAAERLILRAGTLRGAAVTVARLGSVFGRFEHDTGLRDTLSPIHQVMHAAWTGKAVILPRPGPRDWVYAPDVAEAIAMIAAAPQLPEPVYNISSGQVWSVAEWCAALAARRPFAWRLAARSETPTIDYHGAEDRPPLETARAARDLGFRARHGLAEALDDYLDWYGNHNREGQTS